MRVQSLYSSVRQEPDPARRGRLAQDSLAQLGPEDPGVELSQAAVAAASLEKRGALSELALKGLAGGQSEAALAASLGLAGGNAVASAALGRLGPPGEAVAAVARAAHFGNSQKAALEVGLKSLAGGAPLSVTLLKMAQKGLADSSHDDRSSMAQRAVRTLDTPGCAMGALALDAMKYRDTSRKVAEIALACGSSTRELARAASAMVDKAFLNYDGGRWSDEKSGVARACLDYLAQHAALESERAFAGTVREMLRATSFSQTNVKVAQLAFSCLERGDLSPRRQAAVFAQMTAASSDGKDSSGKYQCDKSEVARAGAAALAGEPVGRLLVAALADGKFSKSNASLAEVGFEAIAKGRTDVCRVARSMIEGCTNGTNSKGAFQADKTTVMRAMLPVLEELAPAGKPAFEMFQAAHSGTTFASGYEKNARTMLGYVADGRVSDRELVSLARRMIEGATAGQSSSYAYQDDKTPVGLNSARYLAAHATDASVRSHCAFLSEALQDTTFTKTMVPVSDHILARAERGATLNRARLGRELVKKALASETSRGAWADDKTQVALNVLDSIAAASSAEEARAAKQVRSAIAACKWSRSTEKLAATGFNALEKGRFGLAALARELIPCGHVGEYEQDQGPLAAAMVDFAARSEPDRARQKSLLLVRGMLDTAVDHRVRVELAGKVLERTDLSVGWAAEQVRSPEHRAVMLEGALEQLAALKGHPEAAAEILGRAPSDPLARCTHLMAGLETMDARFLTADEEAQALLDSVKGKNAVGVREESNYVVIGGVRVRKEK